MENLPDGTAHVVALTERFGPAPDEDDLVDDIVGPSEVQTYSRSRGGDGETAVYRPGDELPLELAGRSWSQSEDLAAFDADGERLDEPARRRPSARTGPGGPTSADVAIAYWKGRRFGAEAALEELRQLLGREDPDGG